MYLKSIGSDDFVSLEIVYYFQCAYQFIDAVRINYYEYLKKTFLISILILFIKV